MTLQSLTLLETAQVCPSLLETFSVGELTCLFNSSKDWQNFITEQYHDSWLLTAINPKRKIAYQFNHLVLRKVEQQHLADYLHTLNSLELSPKQLPWLSNYAIEFIDWMEKCPHLNDYALIDELLQLVRKTSKKTLLQRKYFQVVGARNLL